MAEMKGAVRTCQRRVAFHEVVGITNSDKNTDLIAFQTEL